MALSRYFANTNLAEMTDISEGRVLKTSYIHKFGRNPSIGGTPETVWMRGGVYTYLTSPSTVYVSSDNGNDAAGGTGAAGGTSGAGISGAGGSGGGGSPDGGASSGSGMTHNFYFYFFLIFPLYY